MGNFEWCMLWLSGILLGGYNDCQIDNAYADGKPLPGAGHVPVHWTKQVSGGSIPESSRTFLQGL